MMIIFIAIPYQAFALNKAQRFEIERRFWYDETDTGCGTTDTSGPGNFTGGSNAEIAFNFLVSKGLTVEQAAGIVGNMEVEAPGVNPKAVNPKSGATGIIQWLGGRKDALFAYGKANNTDPLTLELQLRFLWDEANGGESAAFNQFKTDTANDKGANGAAHAAERFDTLYERSEGTTIPQRQQYAREAYNAFASQAPASPTQPTDPSTPAPSDAVDPCAPGIVTGNGVGGIDVFPQQINKRTLQSPGVGATWCYASTANCHHDYNAADIHAPEGTVNVAAKGGTVVRVTDQVGGVGSRVTIRGGDGKFIYYYAHMAAGSLKVAEDQTIATGTPLGNVGNSTQAVGTPPHLHFDMLPASEFSYRVDCSGSACSGYPFVNVQPLLVQLYQGLPN